MLETLAFELMLDIDPHDGFFFRPDDDDTPDHSKQANNIRPEIYELVIATEACSRLTNKCLRPVLRLEMDVMQGWMFHSNCSADTEFIGKKTNFYTAFYGSAMTCHSECLCNSSLASELDHVTLDASARCLKREIT